MKYVIDANVFVAALRKEEPFYQPSRAFLQRIQSAASAVVCPGLVLPECAAAIIRATGDPALAREAIWLIRNFPGMQLVPVELSTADWAAQLAIAHRLKGADSVYIATAAVFQAILITWDGEILERSLSEIPVLPPDEWLRRNSPYHPD